MATKTKRGDGSGQARKRRAKASGYLPGAEHMAPVSIPEIDEAAEAYATVRNERMELTDQEAEKAAELLKLMHEHHLKEYEYDGKMVSLAVLEKVRVRKQKRADAETANGDGEE
jgi:hypothetical protein